MIFSNNLILQAGICDYGFATVVKKRGNKPGNIQGYINPLNSKLNLICYLLALLAHHFLHVSRIRVKSLTLRLLMSYIYMTLLT